MNKNKIITTACLIHCAVVIFYPTAAGMKGRLPQKTNYGSVKQHLNLLQADRNKEPLNQQAAPLITALSGE